LRAALLEPPRLETALEEWRESTSLEHVDYASLTILPLHYRNLLRHGVASDLRDRLQGVYRRSWQRNQLLLQALQYALVALREAGVETSLMKGVPLALRHYADLGARVMGDADLVVRRADVWRALETLEGADWKPDRPVTVQVLSSLGGVNLRDPQGRVIDLNWHILPDNYDPRLDEALWQAAETMEVGRELARCLNPTDHLLEVLCHGLSWAANAPLHWLADAMVLLRTEEHTLVWDRLIEQASRNQRVQTVRAALRYLAAVFDAPVPVPALARLEELRVGLGERAAFWCAERSGPSWPWGRAPLVAASYLRSSRARGQRPGVLDFLRFLSARADCSPAQWLGRASLEGWRHVRGSVAIAARRLLDNPGQVRV
jgi:hypothetical protein